jgi:SAM-dependent methyltransferase
MTDDVTVNVVTAPHCVWCQSDVRVLRTVGDWPIGACVRCDHHQVAKALPSEHLDDVYGDGYFTEGGAGYVDYLSEERLLRKRGARYGRLLARHRTPGTVLDVGAAAGFIAAGLRDAGWRPTGVEPNPAMAQHARRAFGLPMVTGGLASAFAARTGDEKPGASRSGAPSHWSGAETASLAPDARFDAVSLVQVIAHLPDPADALRTLHEHLQPGGLVLIETWDRSSRTARLFAERWHEWSPPSVIHWFTIDELARWASAIGWSEVQRGRYPKWITVEHGASLAGAKVPEVLSRAARRVALPYPGDDLAWVIFRAA